ncbi:PREDICTED: uncharacterized protein LOC109485241 [Branchiostoma belcheri]|uniref:Uncharacterized protein LOC109485241 n=1 Tax=Branchiostoma belcheri TaxID=7741 RepID=A0A6P5AD64_BRABE|nr:PREDICTED: uncharacterized protein LOC109485241 [Branchiostoma belcheri]
MWTPILLCSVVLLGAVCGQQLETKNIPQNGNRRLSPGRSAAVLRQFLHLEGAIGSPASPALETGDKRSFRNGVGKRKDGEEARLVETIPRHQGATELKAEATVFSQNGGHDDIEGTKSASDKRSFRNGVGKRTHFRIVADASLDDEPEALRQTGSDVSSPTLSRDPWEDVQEKGDEQCTPCGSDGSGVCVLRGVCCRPGSGCVIRKDVCSSPSDHALCASWQHSATCRTDGKCVAPGICCRAADRACFLAPECD